MVKDMLEIMLGGNRYLAIDLTQPLKLNVEVYPGDPKPERREFSNIRKTGWQHFVHSIGDHNFQPHADAPNHQNLKLQDKGIESFGLKYCFNRAILIDLSNDAGAQDFDGIRYLIEVKKKHLDGFEKQLSKAEAVVIRTGYDIWLEKNRPHKPENLPYLSRDAASFIAPFSKINVIGIDSLTVDPAGMHDSHQLLSGRLIVESLVHLHKIPLECRMGFDLQTSPVSIEGATGGPVTAYAFVEMTKK